MSHHPTTPRDPMTVHEVASRLRVSDDTVLTMLHDGRLRGVKTLKKWLISPVSVERHLPQEEKP